MLKANPFGKRLMAALATLLCLCGLSFEARAAWQTAGDVRKVERRADGALLILSSGARVLVTFVGPDVVRVRLSPRGVFEPDFSYAIEPKDRPQVSAKMKEADRDTIELMNASDGVRVSLRRRPFLVTVYDADGRVVVADDPMQPAAFDAETGAVETSKRRDPTETYYGFGEKAMPLSRHNQSMVMWNYDTYAYPVGTDPIYQSIGFFTALKDGRAYGLWQDNTYRAFFDMGKTAPERYTFGAMGGELNYYVFTGGRERSPKRVLRDYTDLTGRTQMPPLWALGYQQSRWSYYPEARVRELARRFRAERIPADVLYLDIDYMDGFRIFTWDQTRFPDPRKMINDLRNEGFRVVTIVDPGVKVDEKYSVYQSGRAGGIFCRTPAGAEFHANVWPGVCAFPDFTDPRARAWFGAQYQKLLDDGVSGFWNDMDEPATFLPDDLQEPTIYHHPGKTFPLDIPHDGDGHPGDHARYHNVYGLEMARSTYEGLRQLRPDARPLVITRAGYAGVQRFSSVWTGDNVATWDHLALTIPMLTNLGVSGVALVGADVGGFSRSPNGELYARWLQAAVLTPFLRTHTEAGSHDQEPWSYGDEFTRINRRSIELRYQLLPYIYSLFHEHTETGAPVMRPLWFEYPSDVKTYLLDDEYLVGRDLLVAPVLQEGQVKRRIYLPKGDAWIDWWSGQRYEGGTSAEIDAPLDRLPLFARVGAVIPTQPVVQHTGEMARAPLTLVVISGGDGESRFYQDAGDGYDYLRGAARSMTFKQSAGMLRLSRTGADTASRRIGEVELLGVDARPKELRLDGRPITNASFDEAAKRARFPSPDQNVAEIKIIP